MRWQVAELLETGRAAIEKHDVLAHLLMGTRYFVDQIIQAGGGRGPSDELMVGTYVRLTRAGLGNQRPGGRP